MIIKNKALQPFFGRPLFCDFSHRSHTRDIVLRRKWKWSKVGVSFFKSISSYKWFKASRTDSFIAMKSGVIISFTYVITIIHFRFIYSLFLNDNSPCQLLVLGGPAMLVWSECNASYLYVFVAGLQSCHYVYPI